MSSASDDALPTPDQLSSARTATILDPSGNPTHFSTLLDKASSSSLPLILIFTRHFHCGMCKEFVRALSHSSLLTDPTRVSTIIVGPGQASGLAAYKASVNNPTVQFFADPELELYHALGVTKRSLELGDGGSHHKESFAKNLFSSVGEIVKSGSGALKGGDFKQLGGEFVWSKEGEVVFAHRMRHTKDHSELSALEEAATQTKA